MDKRTEDKPCPFCGAVVREHLDYESVVKDGYITGKRITRRYLSIDHRPRCYLTTVRDIPPAMRKAWNKRSRGKTLKLETRLERLNIELQRTKESLASFIRDLEKVEHMRNALAEEEERESLARQPRVEKRKGDSIG